jgi:hypothetical protein
MITAKRFAAISLAAALYGSLSIAPAPAQWGPEPSPLAVVVNGSVVTFDQPPVVRSGRVFVPLRGVFERLGASVVYANGDIDAQGNGRSVHLHIGSKQAVVSGQTVTMDVAPFLIGARTLVPLRFVAQSLGAGVQWEQMVTMRSIDTAVYIQGVGAPARPTSVPANMNVITGVSPSPNTHVAGSFMLSGHTLPGSRMHASVTSAARPLGAAVRVPSETTIPGRTPTPMEISAFP